LQRRKMPSQRQPLSKATHARKRALAGHGYPVAADFLDKPGRQQAPRPSPCQRRECFKRASDNEFGENRPPVTGSRGCEVAGHVSLPAQ
jgi:hypothetical protein